MASYSKLDVKKYSAFLLPLFTDPKNAEKADAYLQAHRDSSLWFEEFRVVKKISPKFLPVTSAATAIPLPRLSYMLQELSKYTNVYGKGLSTPPKIFREVYFNSGEEPKPKESIKYKHFKESVIVSWSADPNIAVYRDAKDKVSKYTRAILATQDHKDKIVWKPTSTLALKDAAAWVQEIHDLGVKDPKSPYAPAVNKLRTLIFLQKQLIKLVGLEVDKSEQEVLLYQPTGIVATRVK